MATNERMSKLDPPRWWLDKALPLLRSPSVKHADVAREASLHVGRRKHWTPSAISKFIDGTGRTFALANGISAALRIPQPFFVAPSEKVASEMLAVLKREQANATEALNALDGAFAREIHKTALDADRARGVGSSDNGVKSGRGARTERAGRGRS